MPHNTRPIFYIMDKIIANVPAASVKRNQVLKHDYRELQFPQRLGTS